MFDIAIIGAGVTGCAIARELSRYDASICVIEKEEDVCCGTSKANSAIIHAGFDPEPGTLMAKLNVEGNRMMDSLSKDLDIPFFRNGSLVVCTDASRKEGLTELLERGKKNGVEGLRIVEREELVKMEPNISDEAVAALFAPTGGIICPFTLTIALAENANVNGAEFRFDTEVIGIEKRKEGFLVKTNNGNIETKCVINAAGVHADEIHNFVSKDKMRLIPRKGEYCLMDAGTGALVHSTIFMLPSNMGKGILVTPTTFGNLLIGPTATDIDDKGGVNTTSDGLQAVMKGSSMTVKNIPLRSIITSFAGLRAHHPDHKFIIEELEDSQYFFDCAGIESPGLTSAPAIGAMVADMVSEKLGLKKKKDFVSTRKGIVRPLYFPEKEKRDFIAKNPKYGTIVCRCYMVTEGEILDAIHRPLGARSLDGIKRRTGAGMGRCQAGFCSPKQMEILERELKDVTPGNVSKKGIGSEIVKGRIRGGAQ